MKGQKQSTSSTGYPENHARAVLGHELGNVLHGLLGMAELLSESGLTVEQGRWLRAIEQSGRQMASLIRSTWCNGPEGEPCIISHPSVVDGLEILEQVVTSHTPAARQRQSRLLLVVQPELPRRWRIDACLVRQLLDNLVGNAIKFGNGGEVVIEAALTRKTAGTRDGIRLSVSDTGPGINSTVADNIYEAYQGCRAPADRDTGNRGLGLYICRNIAAALGGRILCSSPAEEGCRFELDIPGVLDKEAAPPSPLASRLLDHVWCQLRLKNTLRSSVANFLTRLGVPFGNTGQIAPSGGWILQVCEVQSQTAKGPQTLLLIPDPRHSSPVPPRKIIEAPVLESSIGSCLLEIALEWQDLVIRNESRGSTPRPR